MPTQKFTRKTGIVTEAQQLLLPDDFPEGVRLMVVTASGGWVNVKHGDWIIPEEKPGFYHALDDAAFQAQFQAADPAAKADVTFQPMPIPDSPKSTMKRTL
jgi:hypothetical protein